MADRVHTMELSSRNKMFRAHMRNMFETHHLEKRVGTMERGKVVVLEAHLRKTLEVKDVARSNRKTSGFSQEGAPSDDRTSAKLVQALATRDAPWSYFGSATLDTWSGQPPPHRPHHSRPKTADASLTGLHRRNNRKIRPAPHQAAESSSGSDGDDKGTGNSTKPIRPTTTGTRAAGGCQTGTRLNIVGPGGGGGVQEPEGQLPGMATGSSAVGGTLSVVRVQGDQESAGRRGRTEMVMNASTMKPVCGSLVTQLPGGAPLRPVTTGAPNRTRRLKSREAGGAVQRSQTLNHSHTSLGAMSFGTAATPRSRHDSEYSDVFLCDDVTGTGTARSPLPITGSVSTFSEVSLRQRRPLSRVRGTAEEQGSGGGRGLTERTGELVNMLTLSEAPSRSRGPKVTFDPSVKGVPGRIRIGPKVRVTIDSDSESDVDLSKVEKRVFDPAAVLRKPASRRKSPKPELQFYVRPQERHRTEHMFMMKKRSLLQRHQKTAKEPVSGSGTQVNPTVEFSATSSRKCRERALAGMVAAHVAAASREAREQRMSQCLSVQAKVGSFLKKISSFILAQA